MQDKILYCQKKHSTWKGAHCAGVAKFIVTLRSKKGGDTVTQRRCDKCATASTAGRTVVAMQKIDQSMILRKVEVYLSKLIGKKIFSSWHQNKFPFIAKFVKDTGVMCQKDNGKWCFVRYDEVAAGPVTSKTKR